MTGNDSWHDRREDALLLDDVDLVGLDEPKKQLISWLVNGGSVRKVVAVCAMGGIGKTTLVKKVYDDCEVKKHFKTRVWITVSQSSNKEDLFKDMIKTLSFVIRRPIPEGMDSMSSDEMKIIIKNLLQRRKYLVVLDDVWHINEWKSVKHALSNNNYGSRVMLTTRKADVASTCCLEFEGNIYNMSPLPADDSWCLFSRKAFQGKSCPTYLVEFCKYLMKRCEGLPLAIVALSGVLAMKDSRRIDEWDMICRSLGAEIHGNDKLEDLKKVLLLSFNDLPYYLKSCFLYLSIFPEDYLIKHMRMIRLWIAEGFVEAKEGRTLEEVAEDYLKELLNRNLVQVAGTTTDGRVKTYRVHSILREIIISKSRDQDFAATVKAQNLMWPERTRRLSIHNMLPTTLQYRSISQLRSLFIFGAVEKSSLQGFFHGDYKLLRVLDLHAAPLNKFPTEVVDLYYLRYLSFRETKVKMIPRSIGKLKNLETLDLKKTRVVELPIEILQLQRLRHLLIYHFKLESYAHAHCYSKFGFKGLPGIGGLQSLQKLCFIEANEGSNMMIRELGKLNQLKRLGIMKLKQQDGKSLCYSIQKLTNLRALAITSTGENEMIDLCYLSTPPQFLERLYLTGHLEELPNWIPSLHCLVRLFLKWSRLKDDPLKHLQDLPSLVHLELLEAYNGSTLCFKSGKFKKLKLLGLDQADTLEHIEVEKGAMPCLEKLTIQRCNLLSRLPSGIEHLSKLKWLEFFDMPDELIKKLRPDGESTEYWKISHIPEVYSTYWRDGGWDVVSTRGFKVRKNTPPGTVIGRHIRPTLWKV